MFRRHLLRAARAFLLILAVAAGCSEPGAPERRSEPLEISQARVRALLPGQDKTAAYFTVRNHAERDLVLSGAHGEGIRAIEMHTTIRDGDLVGMRRLESVVIPAGETVRFEPGGRHLMLFGVSRLAQSREIVLRRGDGEAIRVRFETVTMEDQ